VTLGDLVLLVMLGLGTFAAVGMWSGRR